MKVQRSKDRAASQQQRMEGDHSAGSPTSFRGGGTSSSSAAAASSSATDIDANGSPLRNGLSAVNGDNFLWKSPNIGEFAFDGASPNLFSFMTSPLGSLLQSAGAHLYPSSRDWTPFRQEAKNITENLSFPEGVLSSPLQLMQHQQHLSQLKGLSKRSSAKGSSSKSSAKQEDSSDFSIHFLSPGMNISPGSSSASGISNLQAAAAGTLDFDGIAYDYSTHESGNNMEASDRCGDYVSPAAHTLGDVSVSSSFSSSAMTAVPAYSVSSSIETTSSSGTTAPHGSVLPPKARKGNKRSLEEQQQLQMDHVAALSNNPSLTPYANQLQKLNMSDSQQRQGSAFAVPSKKKNTTSAAKTKTATATTNESQNSVPKRKRPNNQSATTHTELSAKLGSMGPPQKGPVYAGMSVPVTSSANAVAAGTGSFFPSSTTAFAPLKKGGTGADADGVLGMAAHQPNRLLPGGGDNLSVAETYKSPPTGGGAGVSVALVTGDRTSVTAKNNNNGDSGSGAQLQISGVVLTCNCKKSRCLKMYCDCFRFAELCRDSCNCNNCFNMDVNNADRQNAIATILERKPDAFKPRVSEDNVGNTKSHLTGCHCRKSNCLKKYCECYTGGAPCVDRCRCMECKNKPELYANTLNNGSTLVNGKAMNIKGSPSGTIGSSSIATSSGTKPSPRKSSPSKRGDGNRVLAAINNSAGNTPMTISSTAAGSPGTALVGRQASLHSTAMHGAHLVT